jgi:hypothetical protein
VVAQHFDPDQRARERDLDLRIVDQRLAVERTLGRHAHRAVEPGAQLDLTGERCGTALVSQRVHRDLPPIAALAEEVLLGHDDVVEEELAELRVAGDLGHGPQLDAGRAHVHDQHRDAAVRGHGLIRAGEHPAPPRELAPGHPCLLSTEDEVVVALDGARAQRREVGSGLRLGEPLAPDLLGREDRRHVTAPLLVRAEAQQRWAEDVEPDDVDELGGAGSGELLIDDDLLGDRPSPAPELERPRASDVAGLVAARLPVPQDVHALLQRPWQPRRVRALRGEEGPDLVLEPAF